MARIRLSTTVDEGLLARARALRVGRNDASLIDQALSALLVRHRAAEIDAQYAAAYATQPLDEADNWGDLSAFREAAGAS